ncbi:MAG TPA: HAD-IIA family hydrolase [Ilumatobacter sp.]|nr:HAD-IIA family hydrolase [Ilumatobacter sp.]
MELTSDQSTPVQSVRFVLCDLDGVVWLAHQALPGAPQAIEALRTSGRRVLFVTNNSASRIGEQEAALAAVGIPAINDVVSSAQAAATLIEAGSTVMIGGGAGIFEAVEARGGRAVSADYVGHVDAVVVGLFLDLDYPKLAALSGAVRSGATFIATNDDATYPTPGGPVPGGGAIVAAVATAAGVAPVITGKPFEPMATVVRQRCGPGFTADSTVMVGDRWSTDGAFAVTLGCSFAQVRSGVTAPGAPLDGHADIDVADLAAVSRVILGAPH